MKEFMDKDFILKTETAKKLYHDYAKDMPIFDYHCHLNTQEILEDKSYENITEIWLGGDHYKWRAMRSNGVTEEFITGNANPKEKFFKYAETIENSIGNPLYHWTHLELRRFFGIETILSLETAEEIWNETNQMLKNKEFTARNLIKRSNVKGICTTDDPVDSLEYHIALSKEKDFKVRVLPTFRPDKSMKFNWDGFKNWFTILEELNGSKINNFNEYLDALKKRIDFFHNVGCRVSDHGFEPVVYKNGTIIEAEEIFKKVLNKKELTKIELEIIQTKIMEFLGREYAKRDWVMQIHLGCMRNNSKRMLQTVGPDTGFDSIADETFAQKLSYLLDSLDSTDELPRTVIYNLNPRDNAVIGTLIGCFQGGGIPGKIQFGSGWWFLDQKNGMETQLTTLANLGLLSRFVGMLTDSRSFLSYTRHEYFRRILCNLIGTWVEDGEAPNDMKLLGKMIKDICYNNIENYISK